jgi:hypothetical protein
VEGGDYGFRNENWRGSVDILSTDPANFQKSITFDNLDGSDPRFLQDYDPSHPEGLGPSSSSDGLSFWYDAHLGDLDGNAFIARWNPSVSSSDGTRYEYSDLVAVDPITGRTVVIADGFSNPLAVFADGSGHLLVSDFGTGTVYVLSAVPEPATIVLMLVALPILAAAARRKVAA